MKTKKQIMGTIIIKGAFICFLSIGLFSCSNKPEDTKEVAEDHNDAKFDDAKAKDAQFLVDAAEINLEEIQLSQLALAQSSSADVKELAKMMQDDHNKSLNELQALAASKSITLPGSISKDGQDAYTKLMNESGNNFDKKYTSMMVDGHKDAITKFEKASIDAQDADIRNWASTTLPALRTHLDHAMNCQAMHK
ncbi:MAG: hypothetical protein JWP12_3531 [Bacteroidetes bacterium]|nr:hypothetical protein [Bacteroidota bacterium]